MRRKQIEGVKPRFNKKIVTKKTTEHYIDAFVNDGNLLIDFYEQAIEKECYSLRPVWRTVLNKEDYCNFDFIIKQWNEKMIKSQWGAYQMAHKRPYSSAAEPIFLGEAEKEIDNYMGKDFLYSDKIYGIQRCQEEVAWEKRDKQGKRHQERIQELMKTLPEPQKEFRKNVIEEVFEKNHVLFLGKEKNYCSRCASEIELQGKKKHNELGKCPRCHKKIIFKSVNIKSSYETKKEIVYIQKQETKIVLRYFKASLLCKDGKKEDFEMTESVRTYHENSIENYQKKYIQYSDWLGKNFWSDKMDSYHQVGYGRKCYLYGKNLEELQDIITTDYQKFLKYIAEMREELPIRTILQYYYKGSVVEKLIKAGLKRLAIDYSKNCSISTKPEQRELKKILQISKGKYQYLVSKNGNANTLRLLQEAEENNFGLSEEKIIRIVEEGISIKELAEVAYKTKIIKLLNYLKRVTQYKTLKETFEHYKDYMAMITELDYDLENDVVRYPNNLRQAHDKVSEELYEGEKNKKNKENIKKFPQIKKVRQTLDAKYSFRDKEFLIRAPKNVVEITDEGRNLHHCVGGQDYLKKHNEGKSYIFFMREVTNPEASYYTLEYDPVAKRIIQYYGKNDKKPNKEAVDQFLDKWKKELQKRERILQKKETIQKQEIHTVKLAAVV